MKIYLQILNTSPWTLWQLSLQRWAVYAGESPREELPGLEAHPAPIFPNTLGPPKEKIEFCLV